jgi:hypothetical protein
MEIGVSETRGRPEPSGNAEPASPAIDATGRITESS